MSYTVKEVHKCFQSYDSNNNPLIFSGSEWECRFWTDKVVNNELTVGKVVNDGKVGGKL